MKIIYNRFIPFKGFEAINLFGVMFVRLKTDGTKPVISEVDINHESIHTEQMKELLYVFFYIWYFIEWLIKVLLPPYDTAYKDISFECEAKLNQYNTGYLKTRRRYSWIHYIDGRRGESNNIIK